MSPSLENAAHVGTISLIYLGSTAAGLGLVVQHVVAMTPSELTGWLQPSLPAFSLVGEACFGASALAMCFRRDDVARAVRRLLRRDRQPIRC